MTMLLIALGAGVGAPSRYLTDRIIRSRYPTLFPWGTVAVNVLASLILGAVFGAHPSEWLAALVGTGFCGALSTYSAFGFETLALSRHGAWWLAVGNVTLSLVAGVGAATIGWWSAIALS